MRKKIFYGLILASVLIAGCLKSDTKCPFNDSKAIAPAIEIDSIKNFLQDSGIVASQHPSGYFYKITTAGTGTGIANLCSSITVTYKGSYFSGQEFSATTAGNPATFKLGQVIIGWQKGLPLISKGGDITLFIPPTLGYGPDPTRDNYGNILIPGNSYLIFDVHISDIQ